MQEKVAAVILAEHACTRQRAEAHADWEHLKGEVKRSATPGRIVVSGLALGFASGFVGAGTVGAAGAAGGKLLSGPVFSMLLDTVVPGVLAGLTAAVSGDDDEEDGDQEEGDEAGNAGET